MSGMSDRGWPLWVALTQPSAMDYAHELSRETGVRHRVTWDNLRRIWRVDEVTGVRR